jgi:hypothetical protein
MEGECQHIEDEQAVRLVDMPGQMQRNIARRTWEADGGIGYLWPLHTRSTGSTRYRLGFRNLESAWTETATSDSKTSYTQRMIVEGERFAIHDGF